MPGEGAHEGAQAHRIPPRFAVQATDVDTDNVLDVVAQAALRLRGRQVEAPRPPSVHQVVQGLAYTGAGVKHRRRRLAVEQARQGDAAIPATALEQGHGPHSDP